MLSLKDEYYNFCVSHIARYKPFDYLCYKIFNINFVKIWSAYKLATKFIVNVLLAKHMGTNQFRRRLFP